MFGRSVILLCLLPLFAAFLYQPLEADNVFLRGKNLNEAPRILLVTAHPDDESFFFAPTLLALLARREGSRKLAADQDRAVIPHVYSLCLSTGDADGLGDFRVGELTRSLDIFGIDRNKRWLLRHPKLQDNITAEWDPHVIAQVVEPFLTEQRIDIILTFDEYGISGHPNHRSIPKGIIHLLTSPPTSLRPPPRLYTLISVPILHKFTSLLAPFKAKLEAHVILTLQAWFSSQEKVKTSRFSEQEPQPLFISGVMEYITTISAIRQHDSQLVWFRWLYAAFSQYMWVNRWVEVKFDQ